MIGCVKAIPKADQPVLTVGVEHGCRETLPPILVPDVVQRTHRFITTRVVGFKLLQRAVTLGAHPSAKARTLRSQVGEDLAQPEGRKPEIPEHFECVAELMDRDEVEEWLQIQATCAVGVCRKQSRITARRRRLVKVLSHCDPEVSASGGHHDDAGTDLTIVIVKERQPVWLPALPVRLIGHDDGDVGLDSWKQATEVDVGVRGDIGRDPRSCQ